MGSGNMILSELLDSRFGDFERETHGQLFMTKLKKAACLDTTTNVEKNINAR